MEQQCIHHMGGQKQRFYCKITMDVCPFQRWCTTAHEYQVVNVQNCPHFKKKK